MQSNPLFQKLADIISKAVPITRIVLLAYIDKNQKAYSFIHDPYFEIDDPKELHLLVFAKFPDVNRNAAVDIIEQRCSKIIPVSIIFLTRDEFGRLLACNNKFALAVMRSNQVVYEDDIYNIPKPSSGPIEYDYNAELTNWYKRGITFRKIAMDQFQSGGLGMAAFCIHQAAEQFLIMVMQMSIGYRSGTHNLDKYLRLLAFYVPEIKKVFSRNSVRDTQRFNLLKAAYVNYRYKSEFVISEEDVDYFMEELYKLQYLAETCYYSKIPIIRYSNKGN